MMGEKIDGRVIYGITVNDDVWITDEGMMLMMEWCIDDKEEWLEKDKEMVEWILMMKKNEEIDAVRWLYGG